MAVAYVALGGNLGAVAATLEAAMRELDRLPLTSLEARSSLYRSLPMGPPGQPDFINAVVRLETALPAITLLRSMQQIEQRHGRRRQRERRWGPRTLDLDLLLYDHHRHEQASLRLPHPGIGVRAFVLMPLADVAPPDLHIPGQGRLRELLGNVDRSGVTRIASG